MNMEQVKEWGEFAVIVFVLLGVPGIIGIGVNLYRLRIELWRDRAALYKDDCDRLLSLLKAERKNFEHEREELEKSLNILKSQSKESVSEKERELHMFLTRLDEITSNIGSLDRSIRVVKRTERTGGSVRYQNDKAAIQDTVKLVYKELRQSGQVSLPDMRKKLVDMVYRRLHHGILIRRSGEIDELINDALNTILRRSK